MNEYPPGPRDDGLSRRGFLQGALGAGAVAAITAYEVLAIEADPGNLESGPAFSGPSSALTSGGDQVDVLERMRVELLRALEKPAADRRWVMVIDLRKCVGCHACTIACVAENKLPPGVVYRPVIEEEFGTYPNVGRKFIPRPCMQCEVPPCVPVCPVKATYKNEDGIVVVDYDQCIGCRACLTACPYSARTSDFGTTYGEGLPVVAGVIAGSKVAGRYEKIDTFEYGTARSREPGQSPIGNARKCHFCLHRIKVGELPACVTSCIGRATLFGDANDPTSLVAELIARPNVSRLKEELGTQPRVYYLS
ncbi:MAG: 4Fe-4S ferredoxin iron-sulfur binding domain protein [Chloroflexi bacterium]|nr:4Fe-4S ferredoxin iron-sulfur binding domain protein [Chloroflexota bacterium]